MRLEEWHEAGAAGFLFALENDRHGTGKSTVDRAPCAKCLDEHHDLALVVDGSARQDALAAGTISDHWFEWRTLPEIDRIRRLHIVMAVIEDARCRRARRPIRVGKHHRVTLRGVHRRAKAEIAQRRAHPFGAAANLRRKRRISAHGWNAQHLGQARDGIIEGARRLGEDWFDFKGHTERERTAIIRACWPESIRGQ